MLGKLIKHEFRATGRIMLPLYLILLFLALCANFSVRQLCGAESTLLSIFGGLIMAAFVIAIIGIFVMSVVLMINRFRTNLMLVEGYVMFTLPVSVHQLIWSKIIVSTTWFLATFLGVCLSGFVASFRIGFLAELFSNIREAYRLFTENFSFNAVAFVLESLALILLGCAAICLLFYASMAVGHSFANHKILLSVVFFFVFQFAAQLVGSISVAALGSLHFADSLPPIQAVHTVMGIGIACTLIYGAVFYAVTAIMLKKHLNLG